MELKIKCVNTTTSSDGSQYGKFVIEPLAKGFGTTIGNSLRRVLLSSLEGTAVTSARIEGITHEYTAIPGVLEDVIDVMLNLKGLVVKTDSKEAQHLRIDVDKAGAVLASDIQLPAGVKVVNPDWLICTVAEGGSFHADIIVETGKGYVAHDVPRDSKGISIDFDKLTLEIWSNGSIEVSTALSQASNLLIDHFMQIAAITGQPVVAPVAAVAEVSSSNHQSAKDSQIHTETKTTISDNYYDTSLQIHLKSKQAVQSLYDQIDKLKAAGKLKMSEGLDTKRYAHSFTNSVPTAAPASIYQIYIYAVFFYLFS